MGRCSPLLGIVLISFALSLLIGCSSTSSSNTPNPPNTPASIALNPANDISIDIGAVTTIVATPRNSAGQTMTGITVSYVSSNPAVLTVSTGGAVCAGQWDSLTNPFICTPGPAGVAEVTATASGVSSAPTTVFVHQHIDHIAIRPIDISGRTFPSTCFTQDETWNYEATVFALVGGNLVDITPTVGPLSWASLNAGVATMSTGTTGLLDNQIQLTAAAPGNTQFFTSNSGVNSNSLPFKTCPVESIEIFVQNEGTTSLTLTSGSSKTIQAKVKDTLGNELTKPPLTWSSSNTASVTVPTGAPAKNSASIAAAGAGGATVIASCTPPSCNAGVFPSKPIYPKQYISVRVNPTSNSTATPSAWMTSTQCDTGLNGPFFNCGAFLTQVTGTNNSVGASIFLPNPPNSLLFAPAGGRAVVGSRKGIMLVDPAAASGSTAQTVAGVTGKVLAIASDGSRAVVSDPDHETDPNGPDKVFIYNLTNGGFNTLVIPNATAAAFSPDGLKAYILSNDGGVPRLFVSSNVDSQKPPKDLPGVGSAIAFSQYGAFAYVATPGQVTPVRTCTDEVLTGDAVTTAGTLTFLHPLVGAEKQLIGLAPPSIEIIAQQTDPEGCEAGVAPTVTLQAVQSFNLGQGDFTPVAMMVTADGTKVYIVAQNSSAVLVFDIDAKTTSAIPLVGNVKPLGASVTTNGSRIYVTTKCEHFADSSATVPGKCLDPTLHVIDTVAGGDIQQITFDHNFCTNVDNTTIFCTPDLVAVKP